MDRRGDIPDLVIGGKRQSCAEACIFEAVIVQRVSIKEDSVLTGKLSFKDRGERRETRAR